MPQIGVSESKMVTEGGGLTGLVTDVQVFSSVLSEQEAFRYMDCSSKITGDVAAWETETDWEMVGNTEAEEKDLETICRSGAMEERVLIMPARLNYKGISHSLHIFTPSFIIFNRWTITMQEIWWLVPF